MLLSGGQASLTGILIMRLAYLQLIKYGEYSTKSDSNRIKPLINPAPRGTVVDRNDFPLTRNDHNYRLLLYSESRTNVDKTIEEIAKLLNLSAEEKEAIFKRIKNVRRKSVISLIDELSWDDLARIESNYHKLTGISIDSGNLRKYPYPAETAHVIGYVSLPSEKEISDDEQNLFMHPDFRIGKSGIERTFDEYLRGKFGVKYVEVNAYGIPIRTLSTKPPTDGSKLELTIDFRLQKFTTERIKDDVASVVVMDVKTGEILTLASSPSFDPNNFVEGVSKDYWQQLMEDPRKPLSNKPISALYPPGSTFKLMTALAGLENNFNPATKVFCNGTYHLGRSTFRCWKEEGHGTLDMSGAIKNSCNVYFFTVANTIGADKIAEVAKRFGYGEAYDISLYGSKAGTVPSEDWKKETLHQPWVGGDTLNMAIGQGFVLSTPLQLAVVTSRIANGAIPIIPSLVKNQNATTQYDKLAAKSLVKEKHLALIQEGMNRVVNEVGGTAYFRRIDVKGFEMAGKTGTSQVISKRESEMSREEQKLNQNHALFIGFAPVHDPKYAVSVMVEHGGAGSQAAAPIGRDVLLEIQKLNSAVATSNPNQNTPPENTPPA